MALVLIDISRAEGEHGCEPDSVKDVSEDDYAKEVRFRSDLRRPWVGAQHRVVGLALHAHA